MIVYKYYSPEQYNFDALKNHYFWFSKVSKLNDPFDSSSKLLRPSCFRENLLKECNIDEDKLSSIMLQYGTCSFSKDYDNKILWANYADNYRGFVVAFDDSDFNEFNNQYQIWLPYQEVEYVDSILDYDDFNRTFNIRVLGEQYVETVKLFDCLHDGKNRDKLFTFLCSIKSVVWQSEREMRLICAYDVIDNRDRLEKLGIIYNENGYKIPYEPNFVKRIIVGHNASEETKKKLSDVADIFGLKLYMTEPSNIPFNINLINYKL